MTAAVSSKPAPAIFDASILEQVFAGCFAEQYRTRLVGGAVEPLYVPGQATRVGVSSLQDHDSDSVLHYREDFFASALHEVAHWCIAGAARRRQVDFGYWYTPEDRDWVAQQKFQQVETKPQALEWLFSRACGYRFQLSFDNPDQAGAPAAESFAAAVLARARQWQREGLPLRAERFYSRLGRAFGRCCPVAELDLRLAELT